MHLTNYTGSGSNDGWGPSPSLWQDCPVLKIIEDPSTGIYFWDNFQHFNTVPATKASSDTLGTNYSMETTTTGDTITSTGLQYGGVTLAADTADESASICTGIVAPFKLGTTSGKMWFECSIKVSTIAATTHDFFVGLVDSAAAAVDTPIDASDAIADRNVFGFWHKSGTAVLWSYKADSVTAVNVATAIHTLEADTYVKLGWKFDNSAPTANRITAYVNGVPYTSYYVTAAHAGATAGTDFPNDVAMGLCCQVEGDTSPGTTTLRWWRAAQLA